MNFSDETVEKLSIKLCLPAHTTKAALSSLTLADLMQVASMKAIRDSDNLPQIHACAGAILTKIRTEAK